MRTSLFARSMLLSTLLIASVASSLSMAEEAAPVAKVDPLENLLQQIGSYRQSEQAQDKAREAAFRGDLAEQKRLLSHPFVKMVYKRSTATHGAEAE